MFAVSVWATLASAQVLNPGFETAGANASLAAGWTTDTAAGGPVYGVRTNTNPHSGSFHYEIRLASTGAGPVVQFNQSSVVVIGGASYTFSFYSDRLTGSSGDGDEYNIQWLNSNSTVVGSTGYIGFTPGANAYAQTVVTGLTAPAMAAKANIFLHFAGAAIRALAPDALVTSQLRSPLSLADGCYPPLLAQGLAPFDAARLGVYLHGQAGELVRERIGDAGLLQLGGYPSMFRLDLGRTAGDGIGIALAAGRVRIKGPGERSRLCQHRESGKNERYC